MSTDEWMLVARRPGRRKPDVVPTGVSSLSDLHAALPALQSSLKTRGSADAAIDPDRLQARIRARWGDVDEAFLDSLFARVAEQLPVEDGLHFSSGHRRLHVAVFGLGPISSSLSAQLQLIVVMRLREVARSRGWDLTVVGYDPVWDDVDRLVLSRFGLQPLQHNIEARWQATGPSLVFMPHCCALLHAQLLLANWTALHRLVVVGNSIQQLVERAASKQSQEQHRLQGMALAPACALLRAELPLPPMAPSLRTVLNDTVISVFRAGNAEDEHDCARRREMEALVRRARLVPLPDFVPGPELHLAEEH